MSLPLVCKLNSTEKKHQNYDYSHRFCTIFLFCRASLAYLEQRRARTDTPEERKSSCGTVFRPETEGNSAKRCCKGSGGENKLRQSGALNYCILVRRQAADSAATIKKTEESVLSPKPARPRSSHSRYEIKRYNKKPKRCLKSIRLWEKTCKHGFARSPCSGGGFCFFSQMCY